MAAHCVCVLLTAYVFTVLLWKMTNAQESGPYKVVLKQLKNCADKGTGEMWVRASASQGGDGNTTVYHTGELNLPYGLNDDNFKAVGEAHIRSKDGTWRPIGLVYRMAFPKACSSMKQMGWMDIVTAAGQSTDCPLPKGKLNFKMYAPEPTVKRMNEMKYADYRIKLDFVRKGKKIGSLCYYASVIPSTT